MGKGIVRSVREGQFAQAARCARLCAECTADLLASLMAACGIARHGPSSRERVADSIAGDVIFGDSE